MLRGRAGGDGAPFNLGEATVARAVVELETGERGFGHRLGRDVEQARRIAVSRRACGSARRIARRSRRRCFSPIAARLAAERAQTAAQTAATRVDFFTLVRGEAAA